MKTPLFFILALAASSVSAQSVAAYYTNSTQTYTYKRVQPGSFDESPSGENTVWDFGNAVETGNTLTSATAPTPEQLAQYPTANTVVQTSGDITTQLYLNNTPNGDCYITSGTSAGIFLKYYNSPLVGTFPKAYGDPVSVTNVMGEYTYGPYSGTFRGTYSTVVDGYGSLIVNVGTTPAGTTATRLKIQQDLILSVAGEEVGTAFHTSYNYYSPLLAGAPVFRTSTLVISYPLLSVDEVQQVAESYNDTFASVKQSKANMLVFAPNPAGDVINFSSEIPVQQITITDTTGRTVMQSSAETTYNVSSLSPGIYNITLQTSQGVRTMRMIKK